MDIRNLDKKLSKWTKSLNQKDKKSLLARLSSLKSVFPFNEYEYRLMYLLNKKVISFQEYENLRNNYVNANPYLHVYNIAPRIFGDIWAREHLMDIDHRFQLPSKQIDKKYSGEYDLYLLKNKKLIKIEVKTSRASNKKIRGSPESKALSFKSREPFWMNFQQLKLDIADCFVFIGVWADKILYWVLTNKEVKTHPIISHQHRGGIEYQIGITEKNIKQFDKYLVKPNNLIDVILARVIKKSSPQYQKL